MSDQSTKITGQERIVRILKRISEANLPLVIRSMDDPTIAVKGRALSVELSTGRPYFRIGDVSDRGMQHLRDLSRAQVEFVLPEAKIFFMTAVLDLFEHAFAVSLPLALVSVERRKNARYPCSEKLSIFAALSLWQPSPDDPIAIPFFPHHSGIAGLLSVVDISVGGVCLSTRFPTLGLVVGRGHIDDHARLYFPMMAPIEARLEFKWVKRIKEHQKKLPNIADSFNRQYRFGVEFLNPSDPLKFAIRQFAQQLSQQGAV